VGPGVHTLEWIFFRSGGTGGPHPGMDIFPVLSPRAKPYCGVKCSQGLHFPATIVYLKLGKETMLQSYSDFVKVIFGIKTIYIEIDVT